MVDYASLAITAQRLIDANGRDISLVKQDQTSADPAKPWRANAGNPTTLGPLKAVIVPYDAADVDGQLVRRGDKVAYVAAADTDPSEVETFDVLVDGGSNWKIQDVQTLDPGNTRVVYIIQIRR